MSVKLGHLLIKLLLLGLLKHLFLRGQLWEIGISFHDDLIIGGTLVMVELVEPGIFILVAVISVALATTFLRVIATTGTLVFAFGGLSFFIVKLLLGLLRCSLRSLLLSASATAATFLLGFAH